MIKHVHMYQHDEKLFIGTYNGIEVRDFSLGILLVFCAIFCDFLESKQAGYILLYNDIVISSRLSTLSLLCIAPLSY